MPDNVMKMEFIPVGGRLRPLRSFRDKELIKVVTGVRRCCKTTLMELFAEELKEGGAADDRIVWINSAPCDFSALTEP